MNRVANRIKIAARHPNFAVNYILLRVGRFIGHSEYVKFIILSRGRTGSNILLEMLNSHPNVYGEREIFIRLERRTVDDILSGIYTRVPRRIKAVGFKIFYPHPIDDSSGLIWERLSSTSELRVIHMKRRNALRLLTSQKIARKTNVWYQTWEQTMPVSDRQIHFTDSELREAFQQLVEFDRSFTERFRLHRMIDVYYEDLVGDPRAEYRRVADFLDLEPAPFRITLKRQNPESLSQLISNYYDLKEEFKDTEWSCYFDD